MLTIAAALLVVAASAQTKFYVGGSMGYSSEAYDGGTTTSTLTFLPEFGYVLNANMAVGAELGYNSTYNKNGGRTDGTFTFAPYFRYTFLSFGDVSLFGDGVLSYKRGTTKYDGVDKASNTNTIGISVQPGIAYSLNEHFSLVAKFGSVLGYSSSKPDAEGAKATTAFDLLALNNKLTFGCYYTFYSKGNIES